MSRIPSAADRSLIDQLAARDVTVTARQLERWRGVGIIETDRWRGQGRGGSRSAYPDGTADRVVELVDVLDETRSLDVALLTLFGRGRDIPHESLVAAYTRSYEVLSQYGEEATDSDSWDRAEAATRKRKFSSHPVVRAWRKNILDRPNREESVHFETRSTGASLMHAIQTGEPPMDDTAQIIAEASGFSGIAQSEEQTGGFARAIGDLSFPALAEIVSKASLEELQEARESLVSIAPVLAQLTDVLPEQDDLLVALVSPGLIPINQIAGPRWWEVLLQPTRPNPS